MEQKGWLQKEVMNDRRFQSITLTEKGAELWETMRSTYALKESQVNALKKALEDVEREEFDTCMSVLRRILTGMHLPGWRSG